MAGFREAGAAFIRIFTKNDVKPGLNQAEADVRAATGRMQDSARSAFSPLKDFRKTINDTVGVVFSLISRATAVTALITAAALAAKGLYDWMSSGAAAAKELGEAVSDLKDKLAAAKDARDSADDPFSEAGVRARIRKAKAPYEAQLEAAKKVVEIAKGQYGSIRSGLFDSSDTRAQLKQNLQAAGAAQASIEEDLRNVDKNERLKIAEEIAKARAGVEESLERDNEVKRLERWREEAQARADIEDEINRQAEQDRIDLWREIAKKRVEIADELERDAEERRLDAWRERLRAMYDEYNSALQSTSGGSADVRAIRGYLSLIDNKINGLK